MHGTKNQFFEDIENEHSLLSRLHFLPQPPFPPRAIYFSLLSDIFGFNLDVSKLLVYISVSCWFTCRHYLLTPLTDEGLLLGPFF